MFECQPGPDSARQILQLHGSLEHAAPCPAPAQGFPTLMWMAADAEGKPQVVEKYSGGRKAKEFVSWALKKVRGLKAVCNTSSGALRLALEQKSSNGLRKQHAHLD